MNEPRCYHCQTLLADINAPCPNCLPNFGAVGPSIARAFERSPRRVSPAPLTSKNVVAALSELLRLKDLKTTAQAINTSGSWEAVHRRDSMLSEYQAKRAEAWANARIALLEHERDARETKADPDLRARQNFNLSHGIDAEAWDRLPESEKDRWRDGARRQCQHVWTHQTGDIWCCENCGRFERRAEKSEPEPACPQCKTLLAFKGDHCWACSKEER